MPRLAGLRSEQTKRATIKVVGGRSILRPRLYGSTMGRSRLNTQPLQWRA